jgi:UDP-3-O-[3-hydroxymyristoyl] glucosamine N-acyltransferase
VVGEQVQINECSWLLKNVTLNYSCVLGARCHLGPFSSVGRYARLGNDVRLGDLVSVGQWAGVVDFTAFGKTPTYVTGSRHCAYHAGPGHLGVSDRVWPAALWPASLLAFCKEFNYNYHEYEEYKCYLKMISERDREVFPGHAV